MLAWADGKRMCIILPLVCRDIAMVGGASSTIGRLSVRDDERLHRGPDVAIAFGYGFVDGRRDGIVVGINSSAASDILARGFVYGMFLWKCWLAGDDVEVDFGGHKWLR